jgi:restriction endonuclease S subunit
MTIPKTKLLGELAEVLRGTTITRKQVTPGDVPVIAGGKTPSCSHNISNRSGETITVSASGAYAGYVQYFNHPIFASDCSTIQVKSKDETNTKYLYYALLALQNEIYEFQRGSGQPHVYPSQLVNLEIPVLPFPEQHKIVEILEDHLSRLDAALADVKQAKVKAAQFRKSLLHSIFEGKYSARPDTWEHRAIGDFAEVKGGKRLPKGTKWSDEPTSHPYIRATDIKFGKINNEDLVHVPESVWKSIARYVVEENDVVITIAGTIGEIAVVPPNLSGANLTENAAKVVFDHGYVMPSYMSMYLQSPSVQQDFKKLSRATTQAKLALYRIATVEMPVPTVNEQRKIVEILEDHLSRLDASIALADVMEKQSVGLRRSLLQAAFTGQLTKEVASV